MLIINKQEFAEMLQRDQHFSLIFLFNSKTSVFRTAETVILFYNTFSSGLTSIIIFIIFTLIYNNCFGTRVRVLLSCVLTNGGSQTKQNEERTQVYVYICIK